jgi:hypothetical protein
MKTIERWSVGVLEHWSGARVGARALRSLDSTTPSLHYSVLLCLLLSTLNHQLSTAHAATTINAVNKFAYGANIGWLNWQGDAANGAVFGEYVCSGYIWGANIGWINLGAGTPVNGIQYQNDSAADFGVNHDGVGNLIGYAWGANIGWLRFTNRDAMGVLFEGPKLDLLTGRLSGFVWSANCGWISLSNAFAFVQTDSIQMGADTDGDGITDAWEQMHADNLTTFNSMTDTDFDGLSDRNEYLADTDPLDSTSKLRITDLLADLADLSQYTVTWTSQPTRQYRVQRRDDLNDGNPWLDIGMALIPPDAGPTTTRLVIDSAGTNRFIRIRGVRPLSP